MCLGCLRVGAKGASATGDGIRTRLLQASPMRTFLAVVSFVIIYATGAEISNYVSVYQLGMVNAKFGGADGNFQVGREVLPWLEAIAALSFLVGLWPHAHRLRRAPVLSVILISGTCGLISALVLLIGLIASRNLAESVVEVIWPLSWLVLVGLPALCARKVFGFARAVGYFGTDP